MHTDRLPDIESLLASFHPPAETLLQLVRAVGETLNADRCFLYVRNPSVGKGRIAFCWRKNDAVPDVTEPTWKEDTTTLPKEDPLFAAALATQPSVYVADVETAPSDVLNREFEARTFGHRALIHAHIVHENDLWGILQPCVFGQARPWTENERVFIESLLPRVTPVVMAFVRSVR